MRRAILAMTMVVLALPAIAVAQDWDGAVRNERPSPYEPPVPFSDSLAIRTGETLSGAAH